MAEAVVAPPPGFEVVKQAPPPPPGFEVAAPTSDNTSLQRYFKQHAPRAAESFDDYLKAGFQQSVTGLATRGKMPDVALDENAPWYGRFMSSVAGIAGDVPAIVPGFVSGAAVGGATGGAVGTAVPVIGNAAGAASGTLIGGWAGANALPAGLRAAMMEMYTKGEIKSSSDFIDRALHVAWETGKGATIGAFTGAAGLAAKAVLPVAAPMLTKAAGVTAAEVATLATVSKALEGKLPEPSDFIDAAVLLVGVKSAPVVAGKLRSLYVKTGKEPAQVIADATQDPTIIEDLTKPTELALPRAYAEIANQETARAIVPGDKAVAVANQPFAELPQVKGEPAKPTHVNYDYINTAEDTKLALARLSEVYTDEIQQQRRGSVSWEETSNEAAKMLADTLGGVDTKLLMPREPGTPAGAAEILARKQLTIGAAEAMMGARDELLAKGANASAEDKLAFLQAVERASMIQSEFLGARAEAGRALNILKSTAMEAERVKAVQSVIEMYGKDPVQLAAMLRVIDDPAQALKFARVLTKATTWEKVVEGWKASILSGPVTHMANVLGNGVFAAMRIPIDTVAAGFGALRGGADRVNAMEPIARLTGLLQGSADGLRLAAVIMRTGEQPGKSEQYRTAIEGVKGQVIRLPFRLLSAEDAIFSTMNKRGEAYTLATRMASAEELNPMSREFRERIVQLVQDPPAKMAAEIEAAGDRFTFNTPLGEKGKALQNLVRKTHTEWLVPFIRTPANILKEMTRMTPLAPLVKEWRADIQAGGAARDKALAEIAVGTGISTVVFMHALNGNISGAGEPDAGKRRVQEAAGWQPYSIKVGDTWYNYQRLQPLGTLIGMAADTAEVWDHMNEDEADKTPKMLAVAFANAVTNQTALQGLTNIVQVLADPKRYGPKWIQQYAGSVVPALIAQPTQMLDPVAREVNSIVEAIKARVPGLRGELLPKRDIFGEAIQTKERLGAVSPVTETTETTDKVRAEAARLGLSASDAPKKVHVGRGSGKIGDVKLEPEQRDRFAEIGGKLAHDILEKQVNSPGWDAMPDLMKKRAFAKAFLHAHRAGAAAALPPELRSEIVQEITEKLTAELQPAEQ